ncbi:hypothetical protein [Melittangium boletus]|uniref:Cytochrome c domain-containing protein n=1 Tax=Melittangium boletus DSM 14713 TaxID=1294270 RepID=A0A250IA98_9BACT|nr:hypothetical protein [Melittangium boletus]ATB28130.1 hypothetical protein MEBOL_001575 [Melittangium boletus DSM 14713]
MKRQHSSHPSAWRFLSGALVVTSALWGCGASGSTPAPQPVKTAAPAQKTPPASPVVAAAKPVEPAKPAAAPAPAKAPEPAKPAAPKVDPAALFAKFGCPLCHAPGARYHEKILKAPSRSPEDLAKWIRNPEKFIPGTGMPTYATMIDEPTALVLATWLKEAGPGSPTRK